MALSVVGLLLCPCSRPRADACKHRGRTQPRLWEGLDLAFRFSWFSHDSQGVARVWWNTRPHRPTQLLQPLGWSMTPSGHETSGQAWVAYLSMSGVLCLRPNSCGDAPCREVPCMDGARGAREKSDLSTSGSGAAMYTAFECGRCGRWPWCNPL